MLVLSWSRAVYARFALDQTLESFLRRHDEAFAALDGTPRTLLYDNLKSVVLEHEVRILDGTTEVACHGRSYVGPTWCRTRAADVGPACSDFIERLLGDRPLDRLRSAQGILRLASATAPPGWKPPAPARSRSASIATTP